jgi:hypothetical protein
MKKLLLAAAAAVVFASGAAGAAERVVPMTINFVGDWCQSSKDGRETQYRLPSWLGENEKCTDIISIHYGFNYEDSYCEPVQMKLGKDVAPSGTAYQALVQARCYQNGVVVTPTSGKLRTFEFWRYKGNLTVTVK